MIVIHEFEGDMSRRSFFIILVLVVPFTLCVGGWGIYRSIFPYGYSHCCDLCLALALEQYAEEHDGRFPGGQGLPKLHSACSTRSTRELIYFEERRFLWKWPKGFCARRTTWA